MKLRIFAGFVILWLSGCVLHSFATNPTSGVTCETTYWGIPFYMSSKTFCTDRYVRPVARLEKANELMVSAMRSLVSNAWR
jgi:hypothetical protein